MNEVNLLLIYKGHSGAISSVMVMSDNRTIVSGSHDKTIRTWNMDTHECTGILEGHETRINCLDVTPDRTLCISGSQDGSIRLWDLYSGTDNKVLENSGEEVTALAVTKDSRFALSGHKDGSMILWGLNSGTCIKVLRSHPSTSHMDRNNWLIRSSNKEFAFHDYNINLDFGETFDWKLFRFYGHAAQVNSIAFSPNGLYAVSGSNDSTVRLWDLRRGKCTWIFGGKRGNYYGDFESVFIYKNRWVIAGGCGSVHRWRFSRKVFGAFAWWTIGEQSRTVIDSVDDGVRSLAWIPGKNRMAVACRWKPDVYLFKCKNGKKIKQIAHCENPIASIAISPDGKKLIVGQENGDLSIWEIK